MLPSILICACTCLGMIICVLCKPSVKIGKLTVEPYWIVVLLGAVVALVSGQADAHTVLKAFTADSAINPLKILVLFISMTILSIFLDEVGFFSYLAGVVLSKAKTSQKKLFFLLYVTVSVLTVFTSNDIIILTFTPFICYFAKNAKISPIPYLVAEFIAANTWSMALIIGNPTNIYLATANDIRFLSYSAVMILPTITAGVIAFIVLSLLFRKKLALPMSVESTPSPLPDKPLLIIGLIHLGGCTILLAVGSYIDLPMWIVSLGFAVSLFLVVLLTSAVRRQKPTALKGCLKRAPWQLVPFVLSMFVLIVSLEQNGVTEAVNRLLGTSNTVFTYGISSFLTANVINNIPMSVLFCSILEPLQGAARSQAVYATVIGSNLGAFLTPIGALAGIMWSSILKKHDVTYRYLDFIKYGAAVSVPALAGALGILTLFV